MAQNYVDVTIPMAVKTRKRFENGHRSYRNGKERAYRLHPSWCANKSPIRVKRPGEPNEDLPIIVEGASNADH